MSQATKYAYVIIFVTALGGSLLTAQKNANTESCLRNVKRSGDTCACPKGSQSILGTCVEGADGKLVCKCSY